MITENLSTLKIHKLTQEQYDRELEAGRIDMNALYLTPDKPFVSTKTATLSVSGWSNLTQTISVSGVTADNTVIVVPAPTSHMGYSEAGVYCSAQMGGELTFTCAEVPTINLTVNILIL